MELWNNILNSALLGTSKKPFTAEELGSLKDSAPGITALTLDPEDQFLCFASLVFNYRQCGATAFKKDTVSQDAAPAEERAYCSPAMLQNLRDILHEEHNGLLLNWLDLCVAGKYIVTPEFITVLFSIAEKNKQLRPLIVQCCGKRGEWLSRFNADWKFYLAASSFDEIWNTGTVEQRKTVLRKVRGAAPAKGRAWLQEIWDQENATTKLELLKEIAENISLEDEPWLQSLLKEKGAKVKEEAFSLLKQLPDSFLVKAYEKALTAFLFIKKEKAMLGLVSKIKVEIKMPATIDETVLASGVDKLSNTKGVSDEAYIVAQLLNFIPPSFLENFYGLSPEEIIETFEKEKNAAKFLTALASSTAVFKNEKWALAFAKISTNLYSSILPLLPQKESEKYLMNYFEQPPNDAVRLALQMKEEWSLEFALFVINFTSKNVYQYNRNFYNQIISLLPIKTKEELKKITVPEVTHQPAWENSKDHVSNLLSIKEQTLQSFNKTQN